jgi:hypothetical protein
MHYWLRVVEKIKDSPHEDLRYQQNSNSARGEIKRSPLQIIKNVFFVVYILDIMVLYVIYLYNVRDNPSYSHFQ